MESILFSIDGRQTLGQNIIKRCKSPQLITTLGGLNRQDFSDGEICVDFTESVRGKRVYLLSSPHSSDEIIRLELAIDAAMRSGAKEIIPVLPYFPYARQDKKDQTRGPIGAKVMAKKLEVLGATGIITYDLHADQIQGFFDIPVTHIEGKNVFDNYIASIATTSTVLCGPDAGSSKRVKRMKDQLANVHDVPLNFVMMDKTRTKANKIDEMIIIGNVEEADVIILDDMTDTSGTLCKAADVLLAQGAHSVRAVISHGVLSGNAYKNIGESSLTEVVLSDSLAIDEEKAKKFNALDKIKIISVADKFAKAIFAIDTNKSYEGVKNKIL